MKIRIRKPPTKPNRKHFTVKTKEIERIEYLDQRLDSLVDKLQNILRDNPSAVVKLDNDYGGCYYEGDTPSPVMVIERVVTIDEQFGEALLEYERRLAHYYQWYSENKDAIEKELARRRNT